MLKRWVQGAALLLLLVCATWLGMLWHWDQAGHLPSTRDAVLYLGLLPLLAFAVLLLGHAGWRAVMQPAPAAAVPAAEGAVAKPAGSDEAQRQRSLRVLSAELALPAGGSPSAVEAALKDGSVRPQPDAALRDPQGLPVLAARMPELDASLAELSDELQPWLAAAAAPGEPPPSLQPTTLRALALLREPLRRAAESLAIWPQLQPQPGPQGELPACSIRLLSHLAPGAPALDRQVAEAWLQWLLVRASGLPAAGFVPEARAADDEGAAGLWRAADRLHASLHREGRRDLLLLLAAGSDVDAASVARWAGQGRLFDAQRQPRGLMPGEGAAVLVLGPADWPAHPETGKPLPHLHRVAIARRDKSVEAAGRVSSACLEQTLADALAGAGLPASALQLLVSDADQHSARNGELFGAVIAQLPQLDASEDVQLLGAACGHLEAAGSLAAVALAAGRLAAEGEEQPQRALVLSLTDPQMRLAAVLRTD